jgi:hypothetical protein
VSDPRATDLPARVKLEVKTSRGGAFPLSERDIEGIAPDGHLVALLTDRRLHGPRWVLVPARLLSAKGYSETDLAGMEEPTPLTVALNRGWSEWVLDEEATGRILTGQVSGVADRILWCRTEHPPRSHPSAGNVREVKLTGALDLFRRGLDAIAAGDTAAQAEGQVHQRLLEDVLRQLGYAVLPNPIGVPDILATREAEVSVEAIRARLSRWKPDSTELVSLRDALLALGDGELAAATKVLRQ